MQKIITQIQAKRYLQATVILNYLQFFCIFFTLCLVKENSNLQTLNSEICMFF